MEVEKELIKKNARREKEQEKLNSFDIKNEILELEKDIQGKFEKKKIEEKLMKKKDDVIHCLKQNEKKPLNCDKTIKAFRDEVNLLKDEFLNQYQS